jgi:hypothetical protein
MRPSITDIECAERVIHKLRLLHVQDIVAQEGISPYKWRNINKEMLSQFGIETHYGMTKMVFLHPSLGDWVLKTNQNGPIEARVDYCGLEYAHYAEAVAKGYEEYFAPIYRIPTDDDMIWYLQQRVTVNEERVSNCIYENASDEDFEEAGVSRDDEYSKDDLLESMEYREKMQILFGNACFYDWFESVVAREGLNPDLHEANIGMCGEDQHFVIFDYSGY